MAGDEIAMTTYTLMIEHHVGGPREAKTYSTATNAIDDLEILRAGGVVIATVMRNGLSIDEATLRADEEIGEMIDIGYPHAAAAKGRRRRLQPIEGV